jgi:hypothetical protein
MMSAELDPAVAAVRHLWVQYGDYGLGFGTMLIHLCTTKARQLGYRQIIAPGRASPYGLTIYGKHDWKLEDATPRRMFGQDIIWQTWSRRLRR